MLHCLKRESWNITFCCDFFTQFNKLFEDLRQQTSLKLTFILRDSVDIYLKLNKAVWCSLTKNRIF